MTLPTNCLILVSSSGFTKEAREKAAIHNIKLVVPGRLTDERADSITSNLSAILFCRLRVVFTEFYVTLGPSIHHTSETYEADEQTNVFAGAGTYLGKLIDIASKATSQQDLSGVETSLHDGPKEFYGLV